MSIESICQFGYSGLGSGQQGLSLPSNTPFAGGLRLGEVIEGKVLRQFDGSRYSVSFGGNEQVVDSAVPLNKGELIYGRVVGLDEKVHLKRVYNTDAQPAVLKKPSASLNQSKNAVFLEQLFSQYKAELKTDVKAQILQLTGNSVDFKAISLAALIVTKMGVPFSNQIIQAVALAITSKNIERNLGDLAVRLATEREGLTESTPGNDSKELIKELAAMIALFSENEVNKKTDSLTDSAAEQLLDENLIEAPKDHSGKQFDQGGNQQWLLGRWLLSAQNEGPVDHKVMQIPFWLGSELVYVDMAFFSQQHHSVISDGIRYQKIVISLDTHELGEVVITINAASKNLRINVQTDNEQSSRSLASYIGNIKSEISSMGWVIDELVYTVDKEDQAVMSHVVTHYIAQDCLSRVM